MGGMCPVQVFGWILRVWFCRQLWGDVFLEVFLIFPHFSSFLSIIPIPFFHKILQFSMVFPNFHHFFFLPFSSSFPPGTTYPGGIERPSRNCSMVHGPCRVLAHHMIFYVTFESVYKTTISDLLRHFWIGNIISDLLRHFWIGIINS